MTVHWDDDDLKHVLAGMRDFSRFIEAMQSPLDYHGESVRRIAVFEPGAGIDARNSYFDIPDLIAFVDWQPLSDGAFLRYVCVREDRQGQKVARQLVQHLYDLTTGAMYWGDIYHEAAWSLFCNFRDTYPKRFHQGKNRS